MRIRDAYARRDQQHAAWREAFGRLAREMGVYADEYATATRAAFKKRVVKRISALAGLSQKRVNEFVRAWADSSSDREPLSLALQMAAAEMFGVEPTPYVVEQWARLANERFLDEARRVLRAVYEETQRLLEEMGIDRLVLMRGMYWTEHELPEQVRRMREEGEPVRPGIRRQEADFLSNPLSSWTHSDAIAQVFANTPYTDSWEMPPMTRAVAVAEIPREYIISTPFTGFGCLSEYEYVVRGGRWSVQLYVTETGDRYFPSVASVWRDEGGRA